MDDPQVSAMGKEEFMESLDAWPRAPLRMQAKAQSLTKLSREAAYVEPKGQDQINVVERDVEKTVISEEEL
ncbi:hypothetical protein U1Q18_040322 [Sarracenia purpurea var. burkii]